MILRPQGFGSEDLEAAYAAGLNEEALEDIANVCFHYNLINRLADAFDFPVPEEQQKKRLAKVLNRVGKVLVRKKPPLPLIQGEDGITRPPQVERGRLTMLTTEGHTSSSLRRAVEAFTARCLGGERPALELPEELVPYLQKLAQYAYKIVDRDMEVLQEAGYSEDAIVELTVVGGLGASLVALERLYVLLGDSK